MRKLIAAMMVLALMACAPALAFAEGGNGSGGGGGGGNGSGGGNGGGSSEPLVVTSASIADGSQINAGDSITLTFSKNVCEASVRDANKAHVSVKEANGAVVPATVTLADDQVEPEKRNDMVITFDQPLAGGAYTLTAQAGITSKSGDTLAEDYTLHFNIAAQSSSASAASASASAPAATTSTSGSATSASASASSASASSKSASSTSASSSSSAPSSNDSAAQKGGVNPMIIAIIGVAILVAVFGASVLLKKKK